MRKEEEVVKEKRTLEAVRKNLMGTEGKLGVILRYLGQPIIDHQLGGSLMDQTFLEDPFEWTEDDGQLPTVSMEETDSPTGWEWSDPRNSDTATLRQIGWHFDGLSRGMHVEMKYDDFSKELTLHFRGYLVYKEVGGDLAAYVPMQEWESLIERLYAVAEPLRTLKEKSNRAEQKEEIKKAKSGFLRGLRERWGI